MTPLILQDSLTGKEKTAVFDRLAELMPEAEEIGRLRMNDLSDEAISDIIGIKRNGILDLSITPATVLVKGETMLVLGRYKDIQKCFR